MKILALDIGDRWVGSAIADPLGITCKPFTTVKLGDLCSFLDTTINSENIKTIVIGYPKTLKGKESQQTNKIIKKKEELESKYSHIEWVLWDERLSSKRAQNIQGREYRTKEGKLREHSIAAAFILQSYLDYIAFNNQ